ncbi:MAG TPA: hypothetical protein VN777_15840, partial [Terriglobales bacterium]|nr:hypothetical protein [Terriglobales bacterium]HZW97209.1 hypothetical protein [Candidatus Eremiobacteraceae bacterium]
RRSLPLAIFRYNPEDIEARVAELERISPFWCMLGGSLGEKRWHPDRPKDCVWVGAKVKNLGKDYCTGAPGAEIFQVFFA